MKVSYFGEDWIDSVDWGLVYRLAWSLRVSNATESVAEFMQFSSNRDQITTILTCTIFVSEDEF